MTLLERLDAESDWTIAGLAASEIRRLQSSLTTTSADLDKAVRALEPWAKLDFSFDGFSFDPAEIVFNGRIIATVKTSQDHHDLKQAADFARSTLTEIKARKP